MRLRPFVTLVLVAAAGVARAANLNVITQVAVRDEGGSVVLTIQGSKPPNFTTFGMADPPRFVIDLSEAKFQGVPEDVIVQDGVVNVVKNLSYGSDATSIARVMLAFAVDVEPPDVQTQGTALVVRVARPAGVGAPVASKSDGTAKAAEDAARAEAEKKASEDAARAEAERKAQEDAARAEAEKKAREDAARAEAEKKAQEGATRAEAEKKAQEDAARAEAEKKTQEGAARAEAEKKTQEDAARAEAEKKTREEEDLRKAREAYEQERQAAVAKAAAEEAAKARAERTAKAERREEPKRTEPEKAAEPSPVAEAAPAAEPSPPPPPPATEAAPAPAAAATTERLAAAPSVKVREIGFRQLPGATRVFVRTTVPPRFTIQEMGENTIRLALENTRATRHNDLRFLDSSFFHSAVAMVTPKKVGSGYVVDIRLKERVPFQQKIEGDMLAIDFERPAAAAAAEPAAVPAAAGGNAASAEAVPAALEGAAPAAAPATP